MEKETISFSRLNSSLIQTGGCEHYWWWHYREGLKSEISPLLQRVFDIGKIFHIVAQSKNNIIIDEEINQKFVFTDDEERQAIQRLDIEDICYIQVLVDTLRKNLLWNNLCSIFDYEWEEELRSDLHKFELYSRLDGSSNFGSIVELKTSASKWATNDDRWTNLQAKTYMYNKWKQCKIKPAFTYFVVVKNKTPIVQTRTMNWTGGLKSLENNILKYVIAYEKISKKDFKDLRKTKQRYKCKFCGYRELCK